MKQFLAGALALLSVACGVDEHDAQVASSRSALGTDLAQYSFESGTQGWVKNGARITSVAASTAQSYLGNGSLAVNISTTGSANAQQVTVPATARIPGKTVQFHVYLPAGMRLGSLTVFGQENASTSWRWTGNWQPAAALKLGQWNTLTITLPASAGPLQSLGVEFNLNGAWTGTAYVDTVGWDIPDAGTPVVDSGTPGVDAGSDAGAPVVDSGTPVVDAGTDAGAPVVDSGTPEVDAGSPADAGAPVVDSGTPVVDAGTPVVDAGSPVVDAGSPVVDAGTPVVDAGTPVVDAGTPVVDAGTPVVDAGSPVVDAGSPVVDAGSPVVDAGTPPGPVTAIRFGATQGKDGLVSNAPVDPNLRTVAAWVHLRATTTNLSRQLNLWSLENAAPSNTYQLMLSTYRVDQFESHDNRQGGFLFARVDLGWWFIAETNRASGPSTRLYFKRPGTSALTVASGNTHPAITGITRFLVGTDDATGQNEWMDGDITGVKVWNAELSQAELELEAQQIQPVRTANLHAFYPLQDTASMLSDLSGNGRNLTPITAGGSWSVQPGPAVPYGPGGVVAPPVDAGTPVVDAGSPPVDAGTPVVDAGSPPVDAGTPVVDAGSPPVDAGTPVADAGSPPVDAGTPVADAGTPVADAGTPGLLGAIRFGASQGSDGLFSSSPVDPNLRTVTAWVRLRATTTNLSRQMVAWSIENNPPSTAYQLMVNTYRVDQWESHDSAQGGFLFARVDLGWWFIAETNNASGPRTRLLFKKDGSSPLTVASGNTHPPVSGLTRFLVGTDDATGQNEWLDGDLAGVKVWNAELSDAEIAAEAAQLSPVRTANLHAFYPLQSTATMLGDQSGNGRDLTPIRPGGSWSVQTGPSIPY